jgi:hypothetical protein
MSSTLLPEPTTSGLNWASPVAIFSKRMLDSGKFRIFYGVDLYADHHNTDEYKQALKLVGIERDYKLLRMSFDEALELFDDDYFDFIYFDRYAHTGEEGGNTFVDWFCKVKVGASSPATTITTIGRWLNGRLILSGKRSISNCRSQA